MKKKFYALFLSLCITVSACPPAFALENTADDMENAHGSSGEIGMTVTEEEFPSPMGNFETGVSPMTGEENGAGNETTELPSGEANVEGAAEGLLTSATEEEQPQPTEKEDVVEVSVASYDEFIAEVKKINQATDDAGKKYIISITEDFVLLAEYVKIEKDITLLGNGHVITYDETSSSSQLGFHILKDGVLSLGMPDGGERNRLTFAGKDQYRTTPSFTIGSIQGGAPRGTLNMYDGVEITGFSGVPGAVGVAVNVENGVFNMYGGSINHNTKDSALVFGGIVGHYNPGIPNITAEINLYGGEICGNENTAYDNTYYSGAVLMLVNGNIPNSKGVFRMSGGKISENTSNVEGKTAYGGGVFLYGPKVTGEISDGEISKNAATRGGGMYIDKGADLQITGGTFAGNEAVDGGAFFIGSSAANDGVIRIQNSTITDNTAGKEIEKYTKGGKGGGLYIADRAVVHMEDCTILRNTASYGGGIFSFGQLDIVGGAISENKAVIGGGLSSNLSSRSYPVTIDGTEITNNEGVYGSGVFASGSFVMTSGKVSHNHTLEVETTPDLQPLGGGLVLKPVSGNVQLGSPSKKLEISENQSAGIGGGLYIFNQTDKSPDVRMQNVSVTGNRASGAAGIFLEGVTANLQDAVVTKNTSENMAAGGVLVMGAHSASTDVPAAALQLGGNIKVLDNYGTDPSGKQILSNIYLAKNDEPHKEETAAKIILTEKLGSESVVGVTEECAENHDLNGIANAAPEPSANFTRRFAEFYGDTYLPSGLFKSDNSAYAVERSADKQEAKLAKKTTFTVTFDANGGTVQPSQKETEKDGTISVYPVPVRDKHTFAGWYTKVENGVLVDTSHVFSADTTIYALWKQNEPRTGGGGSSKPHKRYEEIEEPKEPPKKDTTKKDNNGKGKVSDPADTGVAAVLNTQNHTKYMVGYETGMFQPGHNITRAEVAQAFYNLLLDKTYTKAPAFSDVAPAAWYYDAVAALSNAGIITGYEDGTFRPNQPITRAEFAVIAANFAKVNTDKEIAFPDVPADTWYSKAVQTAANYGWISGYEDGTFRPGQQIHRDETASIMNRMLARIPDQQAIDKGAGTRFPDVSSDHWAFYTIVEASTNHTYTRNSQTEPEVWVTWE